jgi:hypothetical protein
LTGLVAPPAAFQALAQATRAGVGMCSRMRASGKPR